MLKRLLERAPWLATASDEYGATALHLAARVCADACCERRMALGRLRAPGREVGTEPGEALSHLPRPLLPNTPLDYVCHVALVAVFRCEVTPEYRA